MPKGHGDVTKAALLSEEEREQSVVITNPALPDNPMIFISDEFEVQTGYSAEEALGRNCRFLQGPETDPKAVEAISEALKTESPITVDILNYKKVPGARACRKIATCPFEASARQSAASSAAARPGVV